jgi:hypothetical protein
VTLGSKSVTLAPGTHTTVNVALNRTGKALLTTRHRLSAELTVSAVGRTLTDRRITFTKLLKRHRDDLALSVTCLCWSPTKAQSIPRLGT